jgi:hypothetical protein
VRFRAGGLRFSVEPEAALTGEEEAALGRLDRDAGDGPAFRIELVAEDPWTSDDPSLFPRWEPAVQRFEGDTLLVSHRSFTARIEPRSGRAEVFRREPRAYPLETVVRTAMMARLPLEGGVPLHAAGVVVGGTGVAFFGASGAGKTTVAGTSPHPVLSDELVAVVRARPYDLVRSGFWGEGPPSDAPGGAPLGALVDLARGPRLSFTRLPPARAVGRILASVPVPHAPSLWRRALAVVADLAAHVPVYRMEWSPVEPPWDALVGILSPAATART